MAEGTALNPKPTGICRVEGSGGDELRACEKVLPWVRVYGFGVRVKGFGL